MDQEETFNRLCRSPLETVAAIVGKELGWSPSFVIDVWSRCSEEHDPGPYWRPVYYNHGWTFSELVKAARERT